MIPYSECLARLKKEISQIRQKVKKFKPHQKEMIKFIHSEVNHVEFKVQDKIITLTKGDENKGFKHILQKHYRPNDLETMDILNLPILFKDAIKLNKTGVSNNSLIVYKKEKNQRDLRLVTNEIRTDKLVVTSYRKT